MTPTTQTRAFLKIGAIHEIIVQNLKTNVETFKMRRESYNTGFCWMLYLVHSFVLQQKFGASKRLQGTPGPKNCKTLVDRGSRQNRKKTKKKQKHKFPSLWNNKVVIYKIAKSSLQQKH